uniref:ShKT domain-containing protein n=1 Tax=Setaria digitata TaxID=48799 RepID=A0A915PSD7_9BILA
MSLSMLLPLIIILLIILMIKSQAEECDCNDEYEKPFCDGINKENDCYVDEDKKVLSAKGIHCAKSCETCCKLPGFQCEDHAVHLKCAAVKAKGLCTTANGIVLSLISAECPRTCGLCGQECVDSNPIICSILKSSCQNEESKKLCPKTCNICQPPNLCFDTTKDCSLFKDSCNDAKLKPLMQLSCNETCGFCDSDSELQSQTTAEPCVDADSR